MSRPRRPWFRFYTEAIHDWKIRRLTPAERWLWVVLLSLARDGTPPGSICITTRHSLNASEIAVASDIPLRFVRSGIAKMIEFEMIDCDEETGFLQVTNWKERQYESDDSTERVAKYRSKQQDSNVTKNVTVTDQRQRQRQRTELTTIAPTQKASDAERKPREPDLLFEALAEIGGINWKAMTGIERGRLNKATKELRSIDATPEDVRVRAGRYHAKWPNVALTPIALAGRWSELEQDPPRVLKGSEAVISSTMEEIRRRGHP